MPLGGGGGMEVVRGGGMEVVRGGGMPMGGGGRRAARFIATEDGTAHRATPLDRPPDRRGGSTWNDVRGDMTQEQEEVMGHLPLQEAYGGGGGYGGGEGEAASDDGISILSAGTAVSERLSAVD